MTDMICGVGMICAIGLGVWGAIVNAGVYYRIGSMVAAISMSVGFAYFGWRPLFGGGHDPATYFGCEMLAFGALGWLVLRGLSTGVRG